MFQSAPEKTKVAPPTIPAMVEDPVRLVELRALSLTQPDCDVMFEMFTRRIYKRILALTFISTCSLYVLIDLSFQVIFLN